MTQLVPTNWLDNRKYKIVDSQLIFLDGRKEKKYFEVLDDEYKESSFFYPTKDCIQPNGEMDIPITYDGDDTIWLVDTQTLGKSYPTTLTKYFGRIADEKIDVEVDEWLQNVQIKIEHKIPRGSILWIKNPKGDIKSDRDRVVMVKEHITNVETCYPWFIEHIPIYECVHIDTNMSLDDMNELSEWKLLNRLSNGTPIKKGGLGEICINDIEIIFDSPNKYGLNIQFLLVNEFISQKTILKFKNHSKDTATAAAAKIGDRLFRWLTPHFANSPRSNEIWIAQNIKSKEFNFLLKKKGLSNWTVTKATEKAEIKYASSLKIFGKKNIVRKFKPKHGRTITLSHINLKLNYNKKREMLKVETYIQKL